MAYDPSKSLQRDTLRQVVWRLVPLLAAMYSVAYLDRINIGSAALTMNRDLGISQTMFGLASSLFLAGYFLLEIPSNIAFVRFGARVWLTRIMISWGIISSLTSLVQDATQLIIARIALGIAEAGFFPGLILYLALWFPKEVRARVFFVTTLPFAVVLGAPASTALIQFADGWYGIAGWRIMFFVEGLPAIALGLVTARYLTSLPAQADWLTSEQKNWLTSVVEVTVSNHQRVLTTLRFFFGNRRLLLYAFAYALLQMGFYAQLIFTPQIISAFANLIDAKLSIAQVGLLTAVPSLISTVAGFFWAGHSDQTDERTWHAAIGAVIGASGVFVATISTSVIALLTGLTILQTGILLALLPLWQLPTRGLSTETAAIVIAGVNSAGIAGSFVSPIVVGWLKDQTGSFNAGLIFIALMLLMASGVVAFASKGLGHQERALKPHPSEIRLENQ